MSHIDHQTQPSTKLSTTCEQCYQLRATREWAAAGFGRTSLTYNRNRTLGATLILREWRSALRAVALEQQAHMWTHLRRVS